MRIAKLLMLALLLPLFAEAAWLEGLRWYQHDRFMRVVFDLSEETPYRLSRQFERGYVDILFQGEVRRRMPDSLGIHAGGVLQAKELRKTSTSLSYRIGVSNIAELRTMTLEEQPYKIVLDFYPVSQSSAGAAKQGKAVKDVSTEAPKPAVKSKKRESKPEPAGNDSVIELSSGKLKQVSAKKNGDKQSEDPERRYQGLSSEGKRRVYVAEVLLQLQDTSAAREHLEKLPAQDIGHPLAKYLEALIYLHQGDDFRAALALDDLKVDSYWGERAKELARRLRPPDEQGLLPGGEISDEDLGYYLNVLRRGRVLDLEDIQREPEAGNGPFSGFLPGLLAGLLVGAAALGFREYQHRQKHLNKRWQGIVQEDGADDDASLAESMKDNYAEITKRVRDELEQHLHDANEEQVEKPDFDAAIMNEAAPAPGAEATVEDKVYHLADEKKSIVEIAETLNLGVDEVRLILELRENAGQVSNE